MTKQAKNSLDLYRNGDPSTIKQLLSRQSKSVKDELMQYFNCSLEELPMRLSIGK